MNKLFTAAETAALDLATAAPASIITTTVEAKGALLQRFFNCPLLRKIAKLKTDPTESVDSQLTNEIGWEADKHRSPLHDLAASNPHVIAVSLFSRKKR